MNTIDSYQFGQIVVGGKVYSSDIIISPAGIKDDWWRSNGHELCLEDVAGAISESPEVLVVGTGASGLMKVLSDVNRATQAQGIEPIAKTTDKACNIYNQLCYSQRVIAALHLTC